MAITHNAVVVVADDGTSPVGSDEWNAAHTIEAGTVTDTHVAAANKDGDPATASMRTLGTGAAVACAGNDARLSDARQLAAGADKTKLDAIALTSLLPTGAEMMWPVATPPTGWLIEDGSSHLIASYPDLSALIRSTYGGADGTHFYLPDGRGLVPVGYKSGDANFGTLGGTGGEATHLLTAAESGLPAHAHTIQYGISTAFGTSYLAPGNAGSQSGNSSTINSNTAAAASVAHPNLQPYRTRNFVIKT